jgi:hypothetical protein
MIIRHINYYLGSVTLSFVSNEDIKNFDFKNITKLSILTSKLDELIIPDGVTNVYCPNISIKKIYIPDSVEYLYCKKNLLEEVELPNNFKYINLKKNKIKKVTIRGEINRTDFFLNLRNNKLEDHDFMNQINIKNFNFKYDYFEEKNISGIRALQKVYVWDNPLLLLKREECTRDQQKLLRFNRLSYEGDEDYQPNQSKEPYFQGNEPEDDLTLEW